MTRWEYTPIVRSLATWLVSGICVVVAVMGWFALRATREWRQTSELLVQRRAEQTADLLLRALLRDMRGAEELVLKRLHWDQLTLDQPYEMTNMVGSAFARYPYLEAFFGWNGDDETPPVLFVRADRRPAWLDGKDSGSRFPVTIVPQRVPGGHLIEHIRSSAAQGRSLAVFEPQLGGEAYQAVTRLMYRTARRDRFEGAFGFLVNLNWVREHYFPELLGQLSRIAGTSEELQTMILDQHGTTVAGGAEGTGGGPVVARRLHPVFFDSALAALESREVLASREWTVRVSARGDPTLALASRGADRTLRITAGAGIALGVGLLLAARAVRASADLAKVRSDFVASVTHELKTPLATIRAVGDAFVHGRVSDPHDMREYSQILDQEAKRLIRLVDNLLAYSRVTDLNEVYTFEPLAPADLIDDALRRFQPQVSREGFTVAVDLAPDLPPLRGDRTALSLVLDNLIDNALRYSGDGRCLCVNAWLIDRTVHLSIGDKGVGIPADEIGQVTHRFVRGRRAPSNGSGLGLAIVARIVADHSGKFSIDSTVGEGTTVDVSLPVMEM